MKRILSGFVVVIAAAHMATAQGEKRPLSLEDLGKIKDVQAPQCAPEGKTVAFVVSQINVREDKAGGGHIWTIGIDGQNEHQITSSSDGEASPRFSPDGKYLAFTSSRPGKAKGNQVWLLDRSGGEAFQLTEIKGRLQSYEWSPDSKRLALTVGDLDPQSGRHTYVYLFDIASRSLDRLTKGKADESSPSWSPDGARIAFIRTRIQDPNKEPSAQLFIVDAKKKSSEKALSPILSRAVSGNPEFGPDGKWIALLERDGNQYGPDGMEHLTVVATDGATPPQRVAASEALDRGVSQPRWGEDDKNIYAIVADDMYAYGARIPVGQGRAVPITDQSIVLGRRDSAGSCAVVVSGDDSHPNEIYSASVAGGKLKFQPLTHQNDALLAEVQLGTTEEVRATSSDGTEVHGLLTTPANYVAGTKIPMLLRIHDGPHSQDQHAFAFERQWFAANGYAVLAVNYRGSAGRGTEFSKAILPNCGQLEVEDLQAMVDHVVKMGVADPNKLGVGGWGYGGILTDYIIASGSRFKAATSGASATLCGKDQKSSYPFLHADRIKTPTLFLGSEGDSSPAVQGAHLMYHALSSRNIDTQMVLYPNGFHDLTHPSAVRDRYERYLAWYELHINGR